MTMRNTQVFIVFTIYSISLFGSICSAAAPSSSSSTVEDKCNKEISNVGVCLNYATGKAKAPTKECCTTVEDIRKRDAVCLCYVIQQVHDGNPTLKQLGVQEAKLLQLPNACKMTTIDLTTDCPKLLNISSTSPDYAIFSNSSSPSPSPSPAPSSNPTADGAALPKIADASSSSSKSNTGVLHRPNIAGLSITISIAITMLFISVLLPIP